MKKISGRAIVTTLLSVLVVVGMAAEKYESEADLADELKLPDPYVAVRLNKLA